MKTTCRPRRVLDTAHGATDSILKAVQAGTNPKAPCDAGGRIYSANCQSDPGSVLLVDPALDSVVVTVAVGRSPRGPVCDALSRRSCSANQYGNAVSVIHCATRRAR